ncbi:uncharacterized protein LOC131935868 [Physella acuta]|uniref:uncharacterized protein LOC131935868 n=1 Tax=Physella acuta TaxID=109671 RepID=UPI0027DCEEC5|nr:uncharacterized protein LOC131935868 [Physella acuta]
MAVDLLNVCKQYAIDVLKDPQVVPNLANVKLQATSVSWTQLLVDNTRNEIRKVGVAYKSHQRELFSEVQAHKQSEIITQVVINTGLVTGINKKLKVSLENAPPIFKQTLGDNIFIDPGRQTSERRDTMALSLGSSHVLEVSQRSGADSMATVAVKDERYSSDFTCQVSCSGDVLFPGQVYVEQINIAQLIADYNVPNVQVVSSGRLPSCSFTMKGRCTFSGNFEQNIHWQ